MLRKYAVFLVLLQTGSTPRLSLAQTPETAAKTPIQVQVTAPDGTLLPGATVMVQSDEGPPQKLTTDAQGVATGTVPPSRWGDKNVARVLAFKAGFGFNGKRVPSGESKLALLLAVELGGQVMDEAGTPLPGVKVTVGSAWVKGERGAMVYVSREESSTHYVTETDAQGQFRLKDLPAGRQINLMLTHPRYATANVALWDGEEAAFKLAPGATFKGRLLDEAGKGIPKILIYAGTSNWERPGSGSAWTDAEGNYTITGLAGGTYNVTANLGTKAPLIAAALQKVVATAEKEVELPPLRAVPGVVMAVRVRDAVTGKPLPEVGVGASGPDDPQSSRTTVTTDAAGEMKIRTLPGANRVYLYMLPDGYFKGENYERNLEVTDKPAPVIFDLKPAPRLRGTVVDETGKPVRAALKQGLDYTAAAIPVDADGKFEFTLQREGPVELWGSQANGTMWTVVGPKEIKPPFNTPVRVKVRQVQPLQLTGRVVTPQGKPVPGAEIEVQLITWSEDGSGYGDGKKIQSDAEGRYELKDIRPEQKLTITMKKAGFAVVTKGEVKREGNLWKAADFVLEPLTASVFGRVSGPDGAPFPGARVTAVGEETVTAPDGSFTISHLPERPVEVVAEGNKSIAIGTSNAGKLDLKLVPVTLQPTDAAFATHIVQEILDDADRAKKRYFFGDWLRENRTANLPNFEQSLEGVLARPESGRDDILVQLAGRVVKEATKARDLPASEATLRRILEAIKQPERKFSVLLDIEEKFPEPKFAESAWTEAKALYSEMESQTFIEDRRFWREFNLWNYVVPAERREGHQAGIKALNAAINFALKTYPEKPTKGDEGGVNTSGYRIASRADNIAKGSLPLLKHLFSALDNESGFYVMALGEAIPVLVKEHGYETAKPFLEELRQSKTPSIKYGPMDQYPQYAFAKAVRRIIPLLGPKAGPEVLQLARQIKSDQTHSVIDQASQALALAARLLPPAEAGPLFREAVAGSNATWAARIASWAYEQDEQLGQSLFEIARSKLRPNHEEFVYGYFENLANFAFYYAPVQPAKSRLILEKAWGQATAKKDDSAQYSIARAMARLDAHRAVEMAKLIASEDGNNGLEARRKISQWVQASAEQRRDWPFDRWGAGDTWGPGDEDW